VKRKANVKRRKRLSTHGTLLRQFQRVIPLTTEVEEDKVDAKFKNGVLTITLPKTPAAVKTTKKIEIKTG